MEEKKKSSIAINLEVCAELPHREHKPRYEYDEIAAAVRAADPHWVKIGEASNQRSASSFTRALRKRHVDLETTTRGTEIYARAKGE